MQRGKFAFWALVVLAALVFIYSVSIENKFLSHEPAEHPNIDDDCLRECRLISKFTNGSKVSSPEVQNQSAAMKGTQNQSTTAIPADTGFLKVKGRMTFQLNQERQRLKEFWSSCPPPGQGLDSTFLSAPVDGRVGNVIWTYLSVLAAAKRHGLRPVIDDGSYDVLCKVFNRSRLTVPSFAEVDAKCKINYINTSASDVNKHKRMVARKDFFKLLEEPVTDGYRLIQFLVSVTNAEDTIPFWHELRDEMVLRDEYSEYAVGRMAHFTSIQNEYLNRLHNTSVPSRKFEYVGVHARKTDYSPHLIDIHPGAELVNEKYYLNAIEWMAKTIKNPLIFIVVSDDAAWVRQFVTKRNDTYMGGNGDTKEPGMDLALLGACNHTIISYGTFGLSGALLADTAGGFTVVYDPGNGTITKEMEFGGNMPGWRIMDSSGSFNYQDKLIRYRYNLEPKKWD